MSNPTIEAFVRHRTAGLENKVDHLNARLDTNYVIFDQMYEALVGLKKRPIYEAMKDVELAIDAYKKFRT